MVNIEMSDSCLLCSRMLHSHLGFHLPPEYGERYKSSKCVFWAMGWRKINQDTLITVSVFKFFVEPLLDTSQCSRSFCYFPQPSFMQGSTCIFATNAAVTKGFRNPIPTLGQYIKAPHRPVNPASEVDRSLSFCRGFDRFERCWHCRAKARKQFCLAQADSRSTPTMTHFRPAVFAELESRHTSLHASTG